MIVPDNATPDELDLEPEGFWEPIHKQVDAWVKQYGGSDDTEPE